MPTPEKEFVTMLRKQARLTRTPIDVQFELTGRCNFDCKMCYVHVFDNQAALASELSTEKWISVFDEAYEAGMLFALLTGGECLLRPDFKTLYLHLYQKGVSISVNTNASLLTDDYISFFMNHPPKNIQISVYGSNNDVYENVTGMRMFDRVKTVLSKLKESKIHFTTVVTPNRFLFDDYSNIIQFLVSNHFNVKLDTEMLLFEDVREAGNRQNFELTADETIELSLKRNQIAGKKIFDNQWLPKPCGDCSSEPEYGSPCRAGVSLAAISWDGKMCPCLSMNSISCSVKEHSFADAWKEITSQIDSIVAPIECSGCAYSRKCVLCPQIRYDGLYSGHCNPALCKYMVKKAESGLIKMNPEKC